MTNEVVYLEDTQKEFIEQLRGLLEDARDGKLVGLTVIKLSADCLIECDSLGCSPDDLSLIGTLHGMAAEITASMAVEKAIDQLFEDLEGEE